MGQNLKIFIIFSLCPNGYKSQVRGTWQQNAQELEDFGELKLPVLIVLKCEIEKKANSFADKDLIDFYGRNLGDIRYFKIKDKEALLNWDKYNDRFKDWSEITEIGNKYIKFYTYGGTGLGSVLRLYETVIDRETGKMAFYHEGEIRNSRPLLNCSKIDLEDLPIEEVEQKF